MLFTKVGEEEVVVGKEFCSGLKDQAGYEPGAQTDLMPHVHVPGAGLCHIELSSSIMLGQRRHFLSV